VVRETFFPLIALDACVFLGEFSLRQATSAISLRVYPFPVRLPFGFWKIVGAGLHEQQLQRVSRIRALTGLRCPPLHARILKKSL